MFNVNNIGDFTPADLTAAPPAPGLVFFISKRSIDLLFCAIGLPILAGLCVGLLLLNPLFNRGPLFFVQPRMGRNCTMFRMVKFRTMRETQRPARSFKAPLEHDRITPLGRFLRKSRLDELPQILHILLGEMSLIGPRPDQYDHATEFLKEIPNYRERHSVRPGLSGLAQVELGYVDTVGKTHKKVRTDLHYITNRRLSLECLIIARTVTVVLKRQGA